MSSLSPREVDEFTLLKRRTGVYESTWWAEDTDLLGSGLDPDLRARIESKARRAELIETADVYVSGGRWLPDRENLHEAILDEVMGTPVENDVEGPALCYFLLGLPGSGKSSVLQRIVARHAAETFQSSPMDLQFGIVDADLPRVRVPEYGEGLGSQVVQSETVHMTYESDHLCRSVGLQRRVTNLSPASRVATFDIIGDPKYLPGTVAAMKDRGWTVMALRTKCDVQVCVDRVVRRALETGRYVPLDLIRDSKSRPTRAMNAARTAGRLDGWAVIDTSANDPLRALVVDGDGTFGARRSFPLGD